METNKNNTTKLFVGGVSHAANEETLRDYFRKYGEVIGSEIVRNRVTNVSRGFGFVVLCVDHVVLGHVLQEDHAILGKKVEVKVAIPKSFIHPSYNGQQKHIHEIGESSNNDSCQDTKIFVGGIPMDLTNEELKAYFENYGTVTDTDIHPTRGFGFVTFDSNEGVRNSLENRVHYLKNKRVEAKVAEPRTGSFQSFHYCGLAQARVPYYYGNLIKPNAFGYSTYLPMCHCLSTRYQSLRPLSDFRKNLSGSVKLLLHLDEVEEGNVGHDTKSDDKEAPYIEEDACRLGVEKLISIEEFDKAS